MEIEQESGQRKREKKRTTARCSEQVRASRRGHDDSFIHSLIPGSKV